MFKKILTLTFIILSLNIFAADYTGEGRFYSQQEDSQAFVKQQLTYLAFRDILGQELDKMGLNSKLFWEKYEEKFDKSFEAIDTELKKKYGLDESGMGKAQDRVKYKEELRSKKLRLKRKFGRIQQAIHQFSIEKISRSPKVPNARYMRLKAKVNKNKLHDIYLKFTTEDVGRTFKNIYLSFNFNLDGTSWGDLGVESEKDFTSVVKGYWKKWFEDNTQTFIENVVLAEMSTENEIELHLKKLSSDLSTGISMLETKPVVTTPVEKTASDVEVKTMEDGEAIVVEDEEVQDLSDVYGDFGRSLWLKLTINVAKKYENEIAQQREFEVSGDYLLIELDTNSFLSHEDFERVSKTYSYEDLQKLSSLAASFIYALPLKSFGSLQKKMASIRKSSNKLDINIENAESLFAVMQVKDFLADRGIRLSLKPVFKSFDGTMGVLMLNFQGQKDNVSDFLSGLDGEGVAPGLVMKVDKSSPLNIRLEKGAGDGELIDSQDGNSTTSTQNQQGKI